MAVVLVAMTGFCFFLLFLLQGFVLSLYVACGSGLCSYSGVVVVIGFGLLSGTLRSQWWCGCHCSVVVEYVSESFECCCVCAHWGGGLVLRVCHWWHWQ